MITVSQVQARALELSPELIRLLKDGIIAMQNINDIHFIIDACRGFSKKGCSNCVAPDKDLLARLEKIITDSPWKRFMAAEARSGLKPHEKLKISLSGCPNGCSRPHIYDLGFIGAVMPVVNEAGCSECGLCASACKEEAIDIRGGRAVIKYDRCLFCGQCLPACPEGEIAEKKRGYRMVAGGRLGRHPRLAVDLGDIFSIDQGFMILNTLLQLHQKSFERKMRLSELLKDPESIKVLFHANAGL